MDIQSFIQEKNKAIEQAGLEFEKTRQRLAQDLEAATQKRDTLIAKLSQERDEAALKRKLEGFPPALVRDHTICSVCGEKMRPFEFMEENKRVKAWACAVGSLQPGHDLVRV